MELAEKVEGLLHEFSKTLSDEEKKEFESKEYKAWRFGGDEKLSNKLVSLVVAGKKRATTSPYTEKEHVYEPDSYGVISDFSGNPRCVIEYTGAEVKPFLEVNYEFIEKEGEGFKNVEEWRNEHRRVFKASDPNFTDNSLVLCEQFRLAFPKKESKP